MARNSRQSKILDIINNKAIETQDELVNELIKSGINATQATVSRDIKELGLLKAMSENGVYRYVTVKGVDQPMSTKLLNVYKETVISVVDANNMVVVRTIEGSAHAVSMIISQLNLMEVIGKIADDDTLLLVTDSGKGAVALKEKLQKLFA